MFLCVDGKGFSASLFFGYFSPSNSLFRTTVAKLSISEVASQLGCTELELSQLLNSHMKVNFANFINVYRVKEIKLRLTQENLSKYTLKALSEQCGFNSKTTFYRVFKNVTGMPPMEYCKKLNLVVDENGE